MTRPLDSGRRALLVLGMHRSGTSAVARVLNLLGAGLGRELVPPGPDNPEGFWEHAEAVRINDDLLHGLGRTWYGMRDMPERWIDSPPANAARQRIGELIERDFGSSSLCAIKDPRMCLTVPLWIDAFEAKGFEVACLFVVRDPREVVASLHHRNRWSRASLYLMWVQYLLEAASATGRRRRTLLTYDQLMSDWRGSIARVGRALQLRWPIAPESAASEAIDGFLDDDYRHHALPPSEADGDGEAMPSLAASLYQACRGIAAGEDHWAAISGLQDAHRDIARLYSTHVEHLVAERKGAERRAQTAETALAEQASVATVVRDTFQALQEKLHARLESMEQGLKTPLQQLQDELSALSGETEARFERQRERLMAVEARIQRQHALLNTLSLRLEQAGRDRGVDRPLATEPLPRTDMQKVRAELASSNATVAALLASTSWKMTAPVRWLSTHVLRRPPALVATMALAAPPADPPRNRRFGRFAIRRRAAAAEAMAEQGAAPARDRRDRRDGSPESVAFRWM
jgi:hypothetical protein